MPGRVMVECMWWGEVGMVCVWGGGVCLAMSWWSACLRGEVDMVCGG